MSKAMLAHGITTKMLPLFFMIIAFLYVSDYTRGTLAFIDPTVLFITTMLVFMGLMLVYEGINNKPHKQSTVATAGYSFFFLFATVNFLYALTIFMGWYNPFTDNGDINLILQIVMGLDILLLIAQTVHEVGMSKRFVLREAFSQYG